MLLCLQSLNTIRRVSPPVIWLLHELRMCIHTHTLIQTKNNSDKCIHLSVRWTKRQQRSSTTSRVIEQTSNKLFWSKRVAYYKVLKEVTERKAWASVRNDGKTTEWMEVRERTELKSHINCPRNCWICWTGFRGIMTVGESKEKTIGGILETISKFWMKLIASLSRSIRELLASGNTTIT